MSDTITLVDYGTLKERARIVNDLRGFIGWGNTAQDIYFSAAINVVEFPDWVTK